MANPFYVAPPNILQALMAGQQGFGMGQQALERSAIQEAGQLYAQGDIKGAQAAAARGNSLQALMGFAQLQNQDRQFGLEQERFGEQKRHAGVSEGLQRQQIAQSGSYQQGQLGLSREQLAETKRQHDLTAMQPFKLGTDPATGYDVFGVRDAKSPSGYRILNAMQLPGAPSGAPAATASPGAIPPPPPGVDPATWRKEQTKRVVENSSSTNPYAAGGKFTEVQGKSATFADRMADSHKTISGLENINAGIAGTAGGVMANSNIPGVGGDSFIYNTFSSDDRQKIMQAQRDFINAILRRESGAAISQSEFENARRQYFPQPGDGADVIDQKRRNRVLAIEGNMREAGPNYKPPEGWAGQGSQGNKPQASVVDWRTYFGSK